MALEQVTIEKLVHGGQGMGVLADGRKVFVWNALPGEAVLVELTKKRRDYAEGIAREIVTASADRVEPRDDAYLSTSPWQIMPIAAENAAKQQILTEAMDREGVDYGATIEFHAGTSEWQYRNKMEYSFWANDNGLHPALYNRGTHHKQIADSSSIARPEIDEFVQKLCSLLTGFGVRGSQLKTVVVRCNQMGECVAALFVKDPEFPEIKQLAELVQGITVCFSNPRSPASVLTKELYTYGSTVLQDTVLRHAIAYDVHSFFQVNLPVFEMALKRIDHFVQEDGEKVDMYAGVGTIGIPCMATKLVELDEHNVRMAKLNVLQAQREITIVQASSETALEHITRDATAIVDPPRAGLHAKLVARINEVLPKQLVYLSCNPSTQARDIALLQENYEVKLIEGYNFFPKTPHIESLAILVRKPVVTVLS
jgi:23S rRNA (uracil-5-)-methyltransferase RumA